MRRVVLGLSLRAEGIRSRAVESTRRRAIRTNQVAGTEKSYRVTFLPSGKTVIARHGQSLLDLALENNVYLEHNCGGNCACSTCHVIIQQGIENLSLKSEDEEDELEDADGLTASSRLGCQSKVYGDVVVLIPSG